MGFSGVQLGSVGFSRVQVFWGQKQKEEEQKEDEEQDEKDENE